MLTIGLHRKSEAHQLIDTHVPFDAQETQTKGEARERLTTLKFND